MIFEILKNRFITLQLKGAENEKDTRLSYLRALSQTENGKEQ